MAKTSGELLKDYRAKQREEGLCRTGCGKPVHKAARCQEHYELDITATRARRAAKRLEKTNNAD